MHNLSTSANRQLCDDDMHDGATFESAGSPECSLLGVVEHSIGHVHYLGAPCNRLSKRGDIIRVLGLTAEGDAYRIQIGEDIIQIRQNAIGCIHVIA